MTDKELVKHLRSLDNSTRCSGCGQFLFLEDCTPEQCNAFHESDSYEDHPPGYNHNNRLTWHDFSEQIVRERRDDLP